MRKILVLAGLMGFVACHSKMATTTAPAGPTQADADRGAATFPGLTVAELNEGKALYEDKCNTACHGLKSLTSRDEAGWRKIVPPMAKKARVDAATENKILKYVVTMSSAQK